MTTSQEWENTARQAVVRYFSTWESRWGYRLLLRGRKHLGWYPHGVRGLPMATAQRLLEDKLGETLALPPGSLVLDAGCGEGQVALRLAQVFKLRVEGIDLLDSSIANAARNAERIKALGVGGVGFQQMDYCQLRFDDATFDGLYTMETLVHGPDPDRALAEFHRVLRPGGRLVLFEYSIAPLEEMTGEERKAYQFIIKAGAMPSLPLFVHGGFPAILARAGFEEVTVKDATARVGPMPRRLAQLGYLPYQAARLLGMQARLINATAAVAIYRHRHLLRYNLVAARKPLSR